MVLISAQRDGVRPCRVVGMGMGMQELVHRGCVLGWRRALLLQFCIYRFSLLEELGTSSREKLLWLLLTPTVARKDELAGLRYPTCVYWPEAASVFFSEQEGLMSSGVGVP